MQYRHELKYLLNYADAELLRERLNVLMEKDSHVQDGQYQIRSLYFDDYWQTAYNDKLSGVNERRKYRIRLYNMDDSFIRLECKIKSASYIRKISAPLTRSEVDSIFNHDYAFLLQRKEPLCRQFYYECVSRVMRPMVYVDYEREPFTYEPGDVRITFDKDVRSASPFYGITDEMVSQHVLEPKKLILEVKFTEFLPSKIQQILPSRAAEFSAVSKYTLCCRKVNYMFAKIVE